MTYSDRLRLYANQTAQLQKQIEPDGYGNMQYEEPQTIKVRKESQMRLVRDTNGETVVSNTTVFTLVKIDPFDKIDGEIVVNSANMVDKAGNIAGWEAYL